MIIAKLIGGLGNQMFQYAVARRLSHLHNDLLKLDITGYQNYFLWNYCLNELDIIEQIATDTEISEIKNINWVREIFYDFDETILQLEGDIYLDGYWQSYKYFYDINDLILKEFTVRRPLSGANQAMYDMIRNCPSVAVHFRRGDYVTDPKTNQVHGVCSLDYYRQAMAEMNTRVPKAHYFIFSNDLAWVKENLEINPNYTLVDINGISNGADDLCLMRTCKYHIISNSTFSWWGAWLAQHPDKIVFAPERWFNNLDFFIEDLIPDSWNLC